MQAEVSPHFRAWMTGKRTESQALKVRNTQTQGAALCLNPKREPKPCRGEICLANPTSDIEKNIPPVHGKNGAVQGKYTYSLIFFDFIH